MIETIRLINNKWSLSWHSLHVEYINLIISPAWVDGQCWVNCWNLPRKKYSSFDPNLIKDFYLSNYYKSSHVDLYYYCMLWKNYELKDIITLTTFIYIIVYVPVIVELMVALIMCCTLQPNNLIWLPPDSNKPRKSTWVSWLISCRYIFVYLCQRGNLTGCLFL